MIRRVPHYYADFHCIASKCKDNCCVGGWEIDIDEETATYYLNLEGAFGDRLRNSIEHREEYCFQLKNGQCPFLNQQNLCEIYQQLGEDKMGVVCTQFPRYSEYYGNIKETGIGLACEEAARIIFADNVAFTFSEEQIEEEQIDDAEFEEELAAQLFETRTMYICLLENSQFTLHQKMQILLQSGAQIQECINENCYENIKKIKVALCENPGSFLEGIFQNTESVQDVEHILYAFEALEVLNDDWSEMFEKVFARLHGEQMSEQEYCANVKAFFETDSKRLHEYENLLKYFVFRYLLKASYDHDVIGKLQFAVASYYMLRDMDIVRFLENDRKYAVSDRLDMIHIFSREVEYSEDNLETLAEEFIFDEIFKPENLCRLLQYENQ